MKTAKKKQLILALVSHKGGGKGTVAEYFEKKYNAHIIRFSFFIEEFLTTLKLPHKDRDVIIRFIEKLRELLGTDVLAHIIKNKIQTIKNKKLIVLDGLRFPEELAYLKNNLPHFKLIAIHADLKTRFFRTKKRGEKVNESTFSYAQFLLEEKRSTEKPISKVMKRADFKVDNSKDIDHLVRQLDVIIEKLTPEV